MKKLFQLFLIVFILSIVIEKDSYAENSSINATKSQNCDHGSAIDSYRCFSDQLYGLEKKINNKIEKIHVNLGESSQTSEGREIKDRLISTQKSWLEYRDGQCAAKYSSTAAVHPPSQSLNITLCKIEKTKSRLLEIQKTFD